MKIRGAYSWAWKRFLVVCLAVAFSFLQQPVRAVPSQAQNGQALASPTTYDRVIGVLFSPPPASFPKIEYRMILRFLPSFDQESQIVISSVWNGNFEVMLYTLPGKSKSIWLQLHDLVRQTGCEDPEEFAKKIRVEVKKVRLEPVALGNLIEEFSNLGLSPYLDRNLSLDGTTYELWYEAMSNQLHFSLHEAKAEHDQEAYPLVRWMNKVKATVEKAR